jgi:hypothetical protein
VNLNATVDLVVDNRDQCRLSIGRARDEARIED